MKKHQSPYATLISEATGAHSADLPKIETIMREEIFHSTLDWQTQAQLVDAAVQASQLLKANRALYEMKFSHIATMIEQTRAETQKHETTIALNQAILSNTPEQITKCRLADEKAEKRLEWARQQCDIAARYLNRVIGVASVH